MTLLRGLLGLAFFCLVAWLLSSKRKQFPWRVVLFGLLLQLGLAAFLLSTDIGVKAFEGAAGLYTDLISLTKPGAELVFGPLADPAQMAPVFGGQGAFVFAFAGTGLLAIISFSAFMALLYHLGIMQVVIWLLARVLSFTLGVSGAEAMAAAANIFVGQTEAPLVVKPYVPGMTTSELNALMTGGFATIAGSVLAVYMGVLGEGLAPHLLTASVLSAPAAFLIAKIMQPEIGTPVTAGKVELTIKRSATNVVEAIANGISDGLKLWLNVIAMLIGFMAVVELINWPLSSLGESLALEGGLSLSRIFGWVFAPVAWLMGVEGWADSQAFGSLLGTKIAVNEFVAFNDLAGFMDGEGVDFASERTSAMAAYALCGFANFASVGIQIGGISPLAPDRKAELSRLAVRAMLGGAFASWMTATVAGMFL